MRWSDSKVQVESKLGPLQVNEVIWQSLKLQISSLSPRSSPCLSSGNHSQRLFQKKIEVFDFKIKGQALWQAQVLLVRWASRVFPNLLQLLQAVTGLLEEKVLPLLWYWLDSRVKKFSMICKFLAGTTHWQVVTTNFVFHVKWNFWWSSQKLIIKALIASLNFSITYWSLSKNRAKEQIHCYYPHSLGWILSQCAE